MGEQEPQGLRISVFNRPRQRRSTVRVLVVDVYSIDEEKLQQRPVTGLSDVEAEVLQIDLVASGANPIQREEVVDAALAVRCEGLADE